MDPSNNTAYFLGFEGEQTGPYSFADIMSQISQGKLNPETLIWWEGQSDWQIISTTSPFNAEFKKLASSPPPITPPTFIPSSKPASSSKSTWLATYAKPGTIPIPVYIKKESSFAQAVVIPIKWSLSLVGIGVVGLLAWLVLSFLAPKKETKPQLSRTSQKQKTILARKKDLAEASSGLILEPAKSVQTLNRLIDENPSDETSKEAIEILLDHYAKTSSYSAAGQLYLKMKDPLKAAEVFLKDPGLALQAEKALFQAYEQATGKSKADLLLRDIQVLIKPLQNINLAKERIGLFEQNFPALPHPFSFYQLNTTEQINILFPNISEAFSQMLEAHIQEEFPQLALLVKPKTEVKRDASNRWRLIGSYRGDISLRNDRLKNVYFIYWLVDNQWILVDTNLTPERSKFAAEARKRYQSSVYTSETLLGTLESVFKQKFPALSLHESSKASPSRP